MVGGQLHFHLETNVVFVNLGENGNIHARATVQDLKGLFWVSHGTGLREYRRRLLWDKIYTRVHSH
jgi:hypothetical protein